MLLERAMYPFSFRTALQWAAVRACSAHYTGVRKVKLAPY